MIMTNKGNSRHVFKCLIYSETGDGVHLVLLSWRGPSCPTTARPQKLLQAS